MAQDPIKLLHTADLHLDSPLKSLALKDRALRDRVATASRTALTRIADFAIDEGVAALLIAGDLFDGTQRSGKTAAFLAGVFDRLGAAGIRVYAIRGNHDAESPAAGALDAPANVHFFDGRGGTQELPGTGIHIHGVSFRARQAPDSLLPKFAAPVPGAVNIGLLHTSLTGYSGHDPYAPCSVADLRAHGFDYWALGHVHKRAVHSETPFVVMPGIPQGRDIGEAGPKSATLINVTEGGLTIAEIATSAVEFRQSDCDVTGAEDAEALRAVLRAHLQDEARATVSDSAILRLSLTGTTPLAWAIRRDADFWDAVARDLAEETGQLWIEQLDLAVAPETAGSDTGAAAELDTLMQQIRLEDGFRAEAVELLTQVLSLMPADRRRDLATNEAAQAALADDLAARGATELAARLRGAGS